MEVLSLRSRRKKPLVGKEDEGRWVSGMICSQGEGEIDLWEEGGQWMWVMIVMWVEEVF